VNINLGGITDNNVSNVFMLTVKLKESINIGFHMEH